MIRQFFLATATLGLAVTLAPAPTFAEMFWLDRSAPDVDVTRRWWRKGDLSDPATNQGRHHPGDALWPNPRNEHEDWLFQRQIDDWRTSYQRGRYIRYVDGGPQRGCRKRCSAERAIHSAPERSILATPVAASMARMLRDRSAG